MVSLVGDGRYDVWTALCERIEEQYDMERLWNPGGKAWNYEYKYRRGGKTLCALYARAHCSGFMLIFGKTEREKFEADRKNFPQAVQRVYDEAQTHRDGKWVMFTLEDTSMFEELIRLLQMKRKPNRK